jgi:PAS domain S-box-containing protein
VLDRALENQVFLASIVESSDDAIISKDLNGIVTSWNRSAERIFGYTAIEMIGRPIAVIAAPDRIDEMPAILNRIRKGERVDHYETKRQRKDGAIIDVSLTVSPIRGPDDVIIGASKIARDISERKRAEQILVEQSERLARSNVDLQQFAYVVSHDLQEPLRTVASLSQLLARRYKSKFDPSADELIRLIVSSATRMSELIRDVLSYSRAIHEENRRPQVFDPKKVIDWVTDNLKAAIEESGASIEVGDLPLVTADTATVTQVFQNLISNAIKYRGDAPPRIRIEAHASGTELTFSVSDNGIGIPASYHETIFGLFKRLHGNEHEGTGIGLAVCKRLIEKQSGRIWVDSQEGQGSTFFFTIPHHYSGTGNHES